MPGATSGFGYASASRTQPHYQPRFSRSTWREDWGVVSSIRNAWESPTCSNKKLERRTLVATLFPNEVSVLSLVTVFPVEAIDEWEPGMRDLALDP